MKVQDVMRRYPITVTVDDDLKRAREVMLWMGVRHLPVMSGGKLTGILSEHDVTSYQARHESSDAHLVERAMTQPAQTASPTDSLTEVASRMAEGKLNCLPVTEKGALIGIVTTTDLLRAQVRAAMQPAQASGPVASAAMTRAPQAVHPDDHLLDAAARMQSLGVRHLPVINGAEEVVGMLSDRDVRTAVGDPRRVFGGEAAEVRLELVTVRDVMTTPVITVRETEPCADVANHFVTLGASAVPVVDERGKLVGIISYIDLLRVLAQHR